MSDLADLKLLVGHDTSAPQFSDDEYAQFLNLQSNDVYMSAHDALMTLSAAASQKAVMTKTGTKTVDFRGISVALRATAESYRMQSEQLGVYGGAAEIAWTPATQALLLMNKTMRAGA